MVLRAEAIETRLRELGFIVAQLEAFRRLSPAMLEEQLSQRWVIERGLIAAASIIFDIAEHILAGHFTIYADTYEDSLSKLRQKRVISDALYQEIKGLGGFRNVLVHMYLEIKIDRVYENFQKALTVFPRFAEEIQIWLDSMETS